MSLDWLAYRLAMHTIGVHCNAAAISERSFAELRDQHEHEHFGPGGLRNHSYTDLSYDAATVEEVLEEAEGDECPIAGVPSR